MKAAIQKIFNECQAQSAGTGGSQLQATKTQSVGNHRYRAEAHGGAGNHRVEHHTPHRVEHAGSDRDAECVVGKGEEKILTDVAHGSAAELSGAHDPG